MATPQEFIDMYHSFRAKMGSTEWTEEQRRNGYKMLSITYLQIETENEKEVETMASLFEAASFEYRLRMGLMGMEA